MIETLCRKRQHIAALTGRNPCVRDKTGHIPHRIQQGRRVAAQQIMPQIPRLGQGVQGRLHRRRTLLHFRRHHHGKACRRQRLGDAKANALLPARDQRGFHASTCKIWSPARSAKAAMVRLGFTAAEVGKTEASTT